jgi:hypothetical protein
MHKHKSRFQQMNPVNKVQVACYRHNYNYLKWSDFTK